MRLAGHHALITGGGTGIGAAVARALAGEGSKLSLVGRRREKLEEVAASCVPAQAGTQADAEAGLLLSQEHVHIASADVTDRAQVDAAFASARAANGPIDILIVNAGVADSAPFGRIAREDWDRLLAVNLTAAFDCAQAALPDLLASAEGRLVFVASVASLRGVPYAAHYAAAKHGLLGLMRSLAAEFAKTSLTVNAVCPGFVDTPMTDQSVARVAEKTRRSEDSARETIEAMNASGRLVHPDAIATMILTLCLPQSRDVNGAAVTIDGGGSA